jgi:cytochrome c biogenesis protein CcmG/thiol:disulfide interchange protein DsbE
MPARTHGAGDTAGTRRRGAGGPRRRWLLVALVALVAGGLAVGLSLVAAGPGGEQALPASRSGGGAPGEQAPSFSVGTLDGNAFAFPTGKPTAILFTASYCVPCLPKAEAFGRIQADAGDRIAVLAVSIDPSDTPASFREWIDAAGNPPLAYAIDADGRLLRAFAVRALSTVVVADGDGRVVFRSAGPDGEDTLRDAVRRAGLA